MYGVIFDFLRDYVIEKHGGEKTWHALLNANGYGTYKIFFPVAEYKDEEIVALATSASEALNIPLPVVLEDFGAFVGHRLVEFYYMYVKQDDWKTFEIIEDAGKSIHEAVHRHNKLRKPPFITSERKSATEIIVHYQSKRKMCTLLKGIVRGLGEHYHETIHIHETQCMLDGASNCLLELTRTAQIAKKPAQKKTKETEAVL